MLAYFFAWYSGQVWPNLIASAVTATGAVGWSHRRLAKRLEQRLERHHELLAGHVTTAVAGSRSRDGEAP